MGYVDVVDMAMNVQILVVVEEQNYTSGLNEAGMVVLRLEKVATHILEMPDMGKAEADLVDVKQVACVVDEAIACMGAVAWVFS